MKIQTYKDEVEEIQKKMVDLIKNTLNIEFSELFIHCVNEEDITGFNFFIEKDKNLVIDSALGLDPNILNSIKTQGLSMMKEVETVSKKHNKEIPTVMEVLYFKDSEEVIPLNYRYDKICHTRGKNPEMLCLELLEKYKKEYSSIVYIQKNDGMVIMKKGIFCYYLEEGKWVHEQGLFSNFNGGYTDWKYIEEADLAGIIEDMKLHPEKYKKANNDISGINAKKILIALAIIAVIIGVVYFVKKPKEEPVQNTTPTVNNVNSLLTGNVYRVLRDDDNQYLVKRNGNKYEVVYEIKDNYIGIYDNKVYFSNTSVKYVDLNDESLQEKTWFDIPQPSCKSDCDPLEIDNAIIIGDVLYFNFDSSSAGTDETDGLLSLSMKANSLEEKKVISPLAEKWIVDDNLKNIYYMNFFRDDPNVYKYNIETSKKEKLFETANYFDDIESVYNYVLYYNSVKDELSIFNVSKRESTVLASGYKKVLDDVGMYNICSVVGNIVYYYNGQNNIIKYDVVKNTKINYYTINDSYFFDSYKMYDDNNLKINYNCTRHEETEEHKCEKNYEYVLNGKVTDKLSNVDVVMKDGSTKNFAIDYFK